MNAYGTEIRFDAESAEDREEVARLLEQLGDFRVLRRFQPPERYCDEERSPDAPPLRRACIVDVETTGLEEDARIIEFSILEFEFDLHTGQVYGVVNCYSGFEDPGFPIPPEITALTGITNEDVAGKKLDEDVIKAIAADSELVIAYKAEFDRPLTERRLPLFIDKHWACALEEVEWDLFGARGKKQLDYMIERILGLFYEGHRGMGDCQATLHMLAVPKPNCSRDTNGDGNCGVLTCPTCRGTGWTPFQHLLQSVQTPKVRVWALNSPFAMKDVLKKRGYAWSDGKQGRRKGWWIDIAKENVAAETAFLKDDIYGPCGERPNAYLSRVTAKDRYSNRV